MAVKSNLELIECGGKPLEIVSCPVCNCVSWVEITHTVRRVNGKNTKGVKGRACLACLINGNTTLIPGG